MNDFNIAEFLQAFGRLEGKLDSLLQLERDRRKRDGELDKRVRSLENWRGRIVGAIALLAAALAALARMV